MNEHNHRFGAAEWPFEVPSNTTAFCTGRVAKEGFPVLHVSHDEDGDWQFLDGTTDDPEDCTILCFGCVFEKDRSLGKLADLPRGWMAWRDSIEDDWKRFVRPAQLE